MPAFLLPLIEKILELSAPTIIRWALAALERKYPGLSASIQSIIKYVEAAENQPAATQNVQSQVEKLTTMPIPDLKS